MADFLGGGGAGMASLGGQMMSFGGMSMPSGALQGAAPSMSFGASPDAPDAPPAGILQDPEEEILRRYQTLQRVRKAAGQAAQIADIDAAGLRRLEAHVTGVLEAAGVSTEVIEGMRLNQQEQQVKEEEQQPVATGAEAAAAAAVPTAPQRTKEELQERAGRVMELGNFWAAQERGEAIVDAAAVVAAAAREAGSFPALAAALRARMTAVEAVQGAEVAKAAPAADAGDGGVAVPRMAQQRPLGN